MSEFIPPTYDGTVSHRFWKEGMRLIVLGGPILGGQLAQQAITFVDTVMAGSISPADLAAVAVGSSLLLPVIISIVGFQMGLSTLSSQLFGAGKYERIPGVVHHSFLLGLVLGLAGFFATRSMPFFLNLMEIKPAVQALASDYLLAASWGIPVFGLYQSLRFYSESLNLTAPVMVIGFVGLAVNIPANFLFIYGSQTLGISPMGSAGCGAATSTVLWAMFLSLVFMIRIHPSYKCCPVFPIHSPGPGQKKDLLALIRLGIPVGITLLIELSVFTVVSLLIATLEPIQVAAHQIALNFISFLFMIPLSIGMAVTIRTGNLLGANLPEQARFAARSALLFSGLFALLFSFAILAFAPQIAQIYTLDPRVQDLAIGLLQLAIFYQIVDAIQVTGAGVLRGYGDTRFPMFIVIMAFWVFALPLGYGLAMGNTGIPLFPQSGMGAYGFWIGFIAGLGIASILLVLRFEAVAYRSIRTNPAIIQ